MAKIQGPKHTPKPTSAAAAAAPKKSAAAAAVKAPKAGTTFPRSAWQDGQKLGVALEKAKAQTAGHPRLKHTNPNRDPIQGEPSRPPIAMRYGLAPTNPIPNPPPPIAMRYGLAPTNPIPNPPPPIAMRYGLAPTNPNPPPAPRPPIAMRYGLAPTNPTPHPAPPIAMRYGLAPAQPREGIPTTPRH